MFSSLFSPPFRHFPLLVAYYINRRKYPMGVSVMMRSNFPRRVVFFTCFALRTSLPIIIAESRYAYTCRLSVSKPGACLTPISDGWVQPSNPPRGRHEKGLRSFHCSGCCQVDPSPNLPKITDELFSFVREPEDFYGLFSRSSCPFIVILGV